MKQVIALAACIFLSAAHSERERAVHTLNRLAFGARPGDVERVLEMGVDRWVAQQLHPESISDGPIERRLEQYETLSMSNREVMETYAAPMFEARRSGEARPVLPRGERPQRLIAELSAQRILRAAESNRQLNEVMVDFWMNHFNVFAGKGLDRFLITSYERDAVRPHVWGRFEDLLMATARSPAMLFYLDNVRSSAPRGPDGGLNENYARELLELHTLGVDGGYTQKDVTELARVLTGWSITRPSEGPVGFVFRRRAHDTGAKSVLGVRLPAGGGVEEGERMIRFLARHPSTARHLAAKLVRRLVSDDPPAALVERVAQRYLATAGDLRATVRAVVESPEFSDPKYYRVKVKSPFEYVVSAIRAVDGTIEDPLPLAMELRTIGQPLYLAQPPTGYSDDSAAWVNSGALLARMNFAISLAAGTFRGVRTDVGRIAVTPDAFALALTGGDLSEATKKTISQRGSDPKLMAGLILGSPEFQRQ